jgi:hypothetical protein
METGEKVADESQALLGDFETSRAVKMDHNNHYRAKASHIEEACRWKDTQGLRDLAVSEAGLLSDEIRRQACQCPYERLRERC